MWVTFQVENIGVMRKEGMHLLERPYQEIAAFKEVQELDPDWDLYDECEKSGKLWVMTARADGVLVGYIWMLLVGDMHYKGLRRAVEDVHYLAPEYRKGLTGYKMLVETKRAMQEKGVDMIVFRTKVASDHGLLLERLGGVFADKLYTIVL